MLVPLVVVYVRFKTSRNELSLVSFALKEYLRIYSRQDDWDGLINRLGNWLIRELSCEKSEPHEEVMIKFPINPFIVEILQRACFYYHSEILDLSKYGDKQENMILEKFLGKLLFAKEFIELKWNINSGLN